MNLTEFASVIDAMADHLPTTTGLHTAYRNLADLARVAADPEIKVEHTLAEVSGWFVAANVPSGSVIEYSDLTPRPRRARLRVVE